MDYECLWGGSCSRRRGQGVFDGVRVFAVIREVKSEVFTKIIVLTLDVITEARTSRKLRTTSRSNFFVLLGDLLRKCFVRIQPYDHTQILSDLCSTARDIREQRRLLVCSPRPEEGTPAPETATPTCLCTSDVSLHNTAPGPCCTSSWLFV